MSFSGLIPSPSDKAIKAKVVEITFKPDTRILGLLTDLVLGGNWQKGDQFSFELVCRDGAGHGHEFDFKYDCKIRFRKKNKNAFVFQSPESYILLQDDYNELILWDHKHSRIKIDKQLIVCFKYLK